jgi:hypothetical protein
MIKSLPREIWKPMLLEGQKQLKRKYAVSNQGRVASFMRSLSEDGKLLKGSLSAGYRTLNLHVNKGNSTIYFHREVARAYCKKKSARHKYVIHLNHKKGDNNIKNLRWVTREEMAAHQQKSPKKIAYKKRQANKTTGLKLTAAQVRSIKDLIGNPNRKMSFRQIAWKFNVSEMTLYRIKSGENWSRVK